MLRIRGSVPDAWAYLAVLSTSRRLRLTAAKIFCKSNNPKRRQELYLGESNQQKSPGEFKNLDRPMFHSCVYNETWWPIPNVRLSYNPTSYWRILFWSGGFPRKFINLKIFRALTDTGRVFCKGVIIKGRQQPSGLPVIGQSWLGGKGDATGASVHAPRQSNVPYGQIVRWYIYNNRCPEHSHLPIWRYERRPQGPAPMDPLQLVKFPPLCEYFYLFMCRHTWNLTLIQIINRFKILPERPIVIYFCNFYHM